MYWNFDDASSCAAVSSSCSEMTDASDVSLSRVMNSLPVGGMTIRTACGTTTSPQDLPARHAERAARELLAGIDREQPGADDLATCTRASFSDSAIHAAMNGVNQLAAKPVQSCGSAYQMKNSCSSVGVARNSQL